MYFICSIYTMHRGSWSIIYIIYLWYMHESTAHPKQNWNKVSYINGSTRSAQLCMHMRVCMCVCVCVCVCLSVCANVWSLPVIAEVLQLSWESPLLLAWSSSHFNSWRNTDSDSPGCNRRGNLPETRTLPGPFARSTSLLNPGSSPFPPLSIPAR